MTEYKVGDKVRVKFEGEVVYANDDNYIEVYTPNDIVGLDLSDPAQVIEKIVDVPTKPGAVLYPYEIRRDSIITRDEEGEWFSTNGFTYYEEDIRTLLQNGRHYVAFEGVEE